MERQQCSEGLILGPLVVGFTIAPSSPSRTLGGRDGESGGKLYLVEGRKKGDGISAERR